MKLFFTLLVLFNSIFSYQEDLLRPREDSIIHSEFVAISKATFRRVRGVSVLSDGTFIVFDKASNSLSRLDQNGIELVRWDIAEQLDIYVRHFQTLRTDSHDYIYIAAPLINTTLVFKRTGKLAKTIKLFPLNESSSFGPDGRFYSIKLKNDYDDLGLILRIFESSGKPLEVHDIELNEPLDYLSSKFLEPVIADDVIYLASSDMPQIIEISIKDKKAKKFIVNDPRLISHSRINLQNYNQGINKTVPLFGSVEMYNGRLFLSVVLNTEGAEFIEIDRKGNLINSYYFRDKNDPMDVLYQRFRIFRNNNKTYIVYVGSYDNGKLKIVELPSMGNKE